MNLNRIPIRRFPEFCESDSYKQYRFGDIFTFSSGKNIKQNEASPEYTTPCVRYGELYHLYGEVITKIINRTNLDPAELKFSNGDEILLPSAGEDPLDIGSASALTLKNVAIGRTINVLRPNGTIDYSPIYVSFYINEKLKKKISTLARGASISNVYNSDLKCLAINLPCIEEQEKVANFLSTVDEKIRLLKEKHALLQKYKKGVMQKLFSQETRFKDDNGQAFHNWELRKLSELLFEHKKRNSDLRFSKNDVLSVSGDVGIVNQIEHLGRSYAGESVENYHIVHEGDIVYTKSPLKSNPYGIIKGNKGKAGIVSTLYAVYSCKKGVSTDYLDHYFSIDENVNRYLRPLVHKGAKNDMKINNQRVLIDPISIPSYPEQLKIVEFLDTFDRKLALLKEQIDLTQTFKKGLLQQMFV